MNRRALLERLKTRNRPFDLVVIGGGATGLGSALDAASRGYDVLLLEMGDFSGGTSSRSTKLIHGGVRYLKQGQISLVRRALKERAILLANAPHLVSLRPFVIPCSRWWEKPFYRSGLALYDALAGSRQISGTASLSREELMQSMPTLNTERFTGGVKYVDGQFDDARLAINLMQTVFEQGGSALNYMEVTGFEKVNGRIRAVVARDRESDEIVTIETRGVVNATGVFSDIVRRIDNPHATSLIRPSQGVHIVLDRSFLPGQDAILLPETGDGRVLFAIPWYNRVLIGTTDSPVETVDAEPHATDREIRFLLAEAGKVLNRVPEPAHIKSVFAGLRPLVHWSRSRDTATLSRDHTLLKDPSGLLTIAGGKWTTYRHMAEETIDRAASLAGLPSRPCRTATLPIHGSRGGGVNESRYGYYGSDESEVNRIAAVDSGLDRPMHPDLDCRPCDVIQAVRREMARTVSDLLARRTRSLFLDAEASLQIAPIVTELMANELGYDKAWEQNQLHEFRMLAKHYTPSEEIKKGPV